MNLDTSRDDTSVYPAWRYFFQNEPPLALWDMEDPVLEGLDMLPRLVRESLARNENRSIGSGAVVHETALIVDSFIDANAYIGEFACIRHSYVASNATVGHCCEVARSLILPRAMITHFCYVGDSLIGADVMMGGGVRTANRRLDGGPIAVPRASPPRDRLGAVIGDNCRLGGGVHPNPGTFIGPDVTVVPGVELRGFIPRLSYVKRHPSKWFEVYPRESRSVSDAVEDEDGKSVEQ